MPRVWNEDVHTQEGETSMAAMEREDRAYGEKEWCRVVGFLCAVRDGGCAWLQLALDT